jgi:hypothetical protein
MVVSLLFLFGIERWNMLTGFEVTLRLVLS